MKRARRAELSGRAWRRLFQESGIDARLLRPYLSARRRFLGRRDVVGIDIGFKYVAGAAQTDAEPVIRFHVRRKVRDSSRLPKHRRLPRTVLGVRTDVMVTKLVRQAGVAPAAAGRGGIADPLRPGVSVAHARRAPGTLGLFAADQASGSMGILSCDHVLARAAGSNPGEHILQPGKADGGSDPGDQVAEFARLDADTASAFALLDTARTTDRRQLGSDVEIVALRRASPGDVLEKSGRTTGVTRAVVHGVLGQIDDLALAFTLVPLADATPGERISEGGDSGSVWYDAATGEGVGLHCRGSRPGDALQFAVAADLGLVFARLGIRLR